MDKYLKQVNKALKCSKVEKERIISDLQSDVLIALENGESWEEIEKRLGTPIEFAGEFNDNLGVIKKSYKKVIIGIVSGIILTIICIFGYQYLTSPSTVPINESKVFQEEKLLESSKQVINCLDTKDYDLLATIEADVLKSGLTSQKIEEGLQQLGELGTFVKVSDYQFVEYKEKGETAAVGELMVEYTKRTVIYRLSFNKNVKLIGLYMR